MHETSLEPSSSPPPFLYDFASLMTGANAFWQNVGHSLRAFSLCFEPHQQNREGRMLGRNHENVHEKASATAQETLLWPGRCLWLALTCAALAARLAAKWGRHRHYYLQDGSTFRRANFRNQLSALILPVAPDVAASFLLRSPHQHLQFARHENAIHREAAL